jgi:two-component system, sensor histidine kinase and response regulator
VTNSIDEQNQNLLFHKVVESAPNAMIMIDSTGKMLLVNLQAEKLFGYPREELLNATIEMLVPERFRQVHPGLRAGFFHSPKTRAMGAGRDLFGRRKDGSEVPVEIGLNPLEIDGKSYVLTSIIDITERKKNEQLIASREAALEASRLKSQFLANMSHEIRTPLNGIIGLTNLLFTMAMTEDQREHLHGIRISADTLLSLINDILDLSKIEADKMEFEIANFNLLQVIVDSVSVTTTAAKEKGLKIFYKIDPQLPHWFLGDASKLKQVLINLLSNAVKFTHEGHVAITVKPLPAHFLPYTVEFEVTDTGIGISEDGRVKLFEPFTQGDNSTSRKYGGTGLGLSISKKLIEKMDGFIDVDSSLGKGTRFWFRLPLEKGQEINEDPSHHGTKLNPLLKAMKILVVEDNAINQRVALGTLKNMGLSGQAVGNGLEALQILQQLKFDLILMDCHMPEMDGYEATIRIRNLEDPTLQKIPIIAMTANVMQGDRERCLSVGMNEYVSKPLVQKDLERVFAKLFPYTETDSANSSSKDKNANTYEDKSVRQAFYNIRITHGVEMTIEVIELFLDGTPEAISKIEAARLANQFELILIEVHGLKSSGYLFGLKEFANHAQQIESACKNKIYDGLEEKIKHLRRLFEASKPLLESELSELRKRST